ncbi:MAG TPA: HD domain-containing protein [Spirochaetota bacterium]|nr:HD domain-containing protein [Spirochaetota bacterium]
MKTESETKHDRVPSEAECRLLIAEHGMLPNIVEHSEQVMRVAASIADDLKDGTTVDRDLVIASALLHDIAKTRSLETRERHDESGGALMRALGMSRVAEIVEQHVFLKDFDPDGPLLEKEIVYYADKRVMHDVVVTLDERVADLVGRYGTTPERVTLIRKNLEYARAVEDKIARFMRTGTRVVFGLTERGDG